MGKGGYNGGSTVIHGGSGWFGRGSVTSQPGEKKKKQPIPPPNSKKKKKAKPSAPKNLAPKGSGLTIAEIVARAEKKVRSVEGELSRAKSRVAALEQDLAKARAEAEKARDLPRKTALGMALHQGEKAKTKGTGAARTLPSKAEREADKAARTNFKNASKEVVVEHRSAGLLIGKRVVKRS